MSEASDLYIYPHSFSSRTLIASIHIYFNYSSSWWDFFFLYVSHIHATFFVPIFFIINQELLEIATKNTVCYMELLQSMPLNFDTYDSISTEITRGQIYSLFHENIWISQLLIEVKNSSQKQKKILMTNLCGAESLFKALSIIVFI